MSERNNINDFDLMMKAILDEAREEVPERVWEGVSEGLDKAARRKTVVLWWRRAAVGVAAAAVVAFGVFFGHNDGGDFVPAVDGEDMIAVVEPVVVVQDDNADDVVQDMVLVAEARNVILSDEEKEEAVAMIPVSGEETVEAVEDKEVASKPEKAVEAVQEKREYFPEDWGEDEKKERGVSFVFSGLAGTNNAISQSRLNPMKRPEVTPAPKETGIEETSVKSSYGIPLSFGVGVKFDVSPKWSIGTGLNYTFLSRQYYGKYTLVNPDGSIESITSSDIVNRQHYIGIPVNAFYDVISNDRINFYAYAGGAVEKCLSDTHKLLKTSIEQKNKVSGVQLSVNAGIGVEFMLGKNLGLYIDPSVRYYFKNGQPKSIRTVQPLMLGFEMGIRARL